MSEAHNLSHPRDRFSKLLTLFVILVLAGSGSGCFLRSLPSVNAVATRWDQEVDRAVSETINKNPEFRELAALCGELGEIQRFELVRRSTSHRGNRQVYYYYRSPASTTDTYRLVGRYLETRGWHEIESLSMNWTFSYQKDDTRVTIQHGGMGDIDYGFTCEKKQESER